MHLRLGLHEQLLLACGEFYHRRLRRSGGLLFFTGWRLRLSRGPPLLQRIYLYQLWHRSLRLREDLHSR